MIDFYLLVLCFYRPQSPLKIGKGNSIHCSISFIWSPEIVTKTAAKGGQVLWIKTTPSTRPLTFIPQPTNSLSFSFVLAFVFVKFYVMLYGILTRMEIWRCSLALELYQSSLPFLKVFCLSDYFESNFLMLIWTIFSAISYNFFKRINKH